MHVKPRHFLSSFYETNYEFVFWPQRRRCLSCVACVQSNHSFCGC